jgi:hypothetical protein
LLECSFSSLSSSSLSSMFVWFLNHHCFVVVVHGSFDTPIIIISNAGNGTSQRCKWGFNYCDFNAVLGCKERL